MTSMKLFWPIDLSQAENVLLFLILYVNEMLYNAVFFMWVLVYASLVLIVE